MNRSSGKIAAAHNGNFTVRAAPHYAARANELVSDESP